MYPLALVLLLVTVFGAVAQESAVPKAPVDESEAQRIKWGLSEAQYRLVHPSRRPGGDTYNYWKDRTVRVTDGNGKVLFETKRGPYGNLLERIPGGPRRPVKI